MYSLHEVEDDPFCSGLELPQSPSDHDYSMTAPGLGAGTIVNLSRLEEEDSMDQDMSLFMQNALDHEDTMDFCSRRDTDNRSSFDSDNDDFDSPLKSMHKPHPPPATPSLSGSSFTSFNSCYNSPCETRSGKYKAPPLHHRKLSSLSLNTAPLRCPVRSWGNTPERKNFGKPTGQSTNSAAHRRTASSMRSPLRCVTNFAPMMTGAALDMKSPTTAKVIGFTGQEMQDKKLPCHASNEDNFMRITSDTLKNLVTGNMKDVGEYLIIDCRFSYEYEGGHIKSAINLPDMQDIETLLFQDDRHHGKVIVLHCEFSNKRAPAFAKSLREVDRSRNMDSYPHVHYPEMYILQGGYAGFYKSFPMYCTDGGYTPMDDPRHSEKRRVHLNNFRKLDRTFSRTQSFTFGFMKPLEKALEHKPHDAPKVSPPVDKGRRVSYTKSMFFA